MMRKLESITITFIPAIVTKDDPKGERAYIAWKMIVEDEDRRRQYGSVTVLTDRPQELSKHILDAFLPKMQADVLTVLQMSKKKIAA